MPISQSLRLRRFNGYYDISQQQKSFVQIVIAVRRKDLPVFHVYKRKGKDVRRTVDIAELPVDLPDGGIVRDHDIDLATDVYLFCSQTGNRRFSSSGNISSPTGWADCSFPYLQPFVRDLSNQ